MVQRVHRVAAHELRRELAPGARGIEQLEAGRRPLMKNIAPTWWSTGGKAATNSSIGASSLSNMADIAAVSDVAFRRADFRQ